MFDILLGRKFTGKCKHAIKNIRTRMVTIVRKKQAMLRFLRKDVAELIGKGHDANAFGRMEALIVEMNLAACYHMIGKFCEYIVIQLPVLQKQRECPREAMEAVSTLIFAAARFSDLPELCDLRKVFTGRYGSDMESSVNPEFVEKIQKKSFSMEKKLHLMQDIAQEFSVTWDCKAFQQRVLDTGALIVDQSKKVMPRPDVNNSPLHASNAKKEAGNNLGTEKVPFKGRFEITTSSLTQREVHSEPRDAHFVADISNSRFYGPDEKARVVFKDEPVNTEPIRTKAANPPYVKPVGDKKGIENVNQIEEGISFSRPSKAEVGKYLIGNEKEGVGSDMTKNMVPPYSNRSKVGTNAEESQGSHIAGTILEAELVDSRRQEGQQFAPPNSSNYRVFSMIPPPYVKQKANLVASVKSEGSKLADHSEDKLLDGDKPKPISVRRWTEQQAASESNTTRPAPNPSLLGTQVVQQRAPAFDDCNHEWEERRDQECKLPSTNEVDRAINVNSSERRRHEGRRSAVAADDGNGDVDEEERALDRLLRHYSRKGMGVDRGNTRRDTRIPPSQQVVDASNGAGQRGHNKVHHPSVKSVQYEKASSFTAEPVSPIETKGPPRASSFEPDMFNSNRLRVNDMHGKLPDYDELAARLITLRNAV